MSYTEIESLISTLDDNDFRLLTLMDEYDLIGSPNIQIIKQKVFLSKNSSVVSAAIEYSCEKSGNDEKYWDRIFLFIEGVDWDVYENVKLSAIYALKFYNNLNIKTAKAVYTSINSANPVTRDAVCVVSQYKSGVESRNIKWGNGSGNLISELNNIEKEWILKNINNYSA